MKNFSIVCLLCFFQAVAWAEDSGGDQPVARQMDNQQLNELIGQIAGKVEGRPGYWRFDLKGFQATVITDEKADRMRIIVPVAAMEDIDGNRLHRLMQANFDSALDARYSIAKGILWSAFIHPLSGLSEHQFVDGLAQTINLAATYGSTYSSGALIFGEGDSRGEQNKYYREIMERESSI